LCENRKDNVTR